ncbi:MAG: DUF427 domain-containing protein [Microlunatus sp.]|nr:DUF427 domain-containing protein [Microlunatus sp.]
MVNGAELLDIAWSYSTPLLESIGIAGLVTFWPEKSVDLEVNVDGQRI